VTKSNHIYNWNVTTMHHNEIPEAPAISSAGKHHIALIRTEVQMWVVAIFQTTAPRQQLNNGKTFKHSQSLIFIIRYEQNYIKLVVSLWPISSIKMIIIILIILIVIVRVDFKANATHHTRTSVIHEPDLLSAFLAQISHYSKNSHNESKYVR